MTMWQVPKRLETCLLGYLKKRYLPERKMNPKTENQFTHYDIRFFSEGAAEMSAYFTTERSVLPKNYLNKKELRAGYILYFVMTNFLKVQFCLKESGLPERFNGLEAVKIADIGCGPGTASLACADLWGRSDQRVEITAIDQNTHALHDAKHIFQAFAGENCKMRTVFSHLHPRSIYNALKGRYDAIIASNFLSETGDINRQETLIKAILSDHLTDNGIIIIIEPALRITSRNLMCLRDRLAPIAHIEAPCLNVRSCPMLRASDRDWCHMYMDWRRPDVIEKVDAYVGNRKDHLKFSYLILSRDGLCKNKNERHDLWRVVSAPMRTKGRTELLLCNESGMIRIARQNKNLSAKNADLDRVTRGDLVSFNGARTVEKDTDFKILVHSGPF